MSVYSLPYKTLGERSWIGNNHLLPNVFSKWCPHQNEAKHNTYHLLTILEHLLRWLGKRDHHHISARCPPFDEPTRHSVHWNWSVHGESALPGVCSNQSCLTPSLQNATTVPHLIAALKHLCVSELKCTVRHLNCMLRNMRSDKNLTRQIL